MTIEPKEPISQTVGLKRIPNDAEVIERIAVRGVCARGGQYLVLTGIHGN